MTLGQRCDEIIRLIEDALGNRGPAEAGTGTPSPALGAAPGRRGPGAGQRVR